jgi:hypothetical protein
MVPGYRSHGANLEPAFGEGVSFTARRDWEAVKTPAEGDFWKAEGDFWKKVGRSSLDINNFPDASYGKGGNPWNARGKRTKISSYSRGLQTTWAENGFLNQISQRLPAELIFSQRPSHSGFVRSLNRWGRAAYMEVTACPIYLCPVAAICG